MSYRMLNFRPKTAQSTSHPFILFLSTAHLKIFFFNPNLKSKGIMANLRRIQDLNSGPLTPETLLKTVIHL